MAGYIFSRFCRERRWALMNRSAKRFGPPGTVARPSDLSRVVRIVVLELHRLLVAEQVGEMRPGIQPIIDIVNVTPSAFLVLSELPILRTKYRIAIPKAP
jgi:hypothetical protein